MSVRKSSMRKKNSTNKKKTKTQKTKSHVTKSHVTKSHVTKSHVTKSHVTKSHVTKSHVTKSHVIGKNPLKLSRSLRFRKFLIVGMGMMGTSLAMAIQKSYKKNIVIDAIVRDEMEAKRIKRYQMINRIITEEQICQRQQSDFDETSKSIASYETLWAEYDLVIFALPISAEITWLKRLDPLVGKLPKSLLFTSISSNYGSIMKAVPSQMNYIGSHPICGSEEQGTENYIDNLFVNKLCFIVVSEKKRLYWQEIRLGKFWKLLKMRVHTIFIRDHDEVMALISHIPHLLAGILANLVSNNSLFCRVNEKINSRFHRLFQTRIALTAGGFKDMIRIAGSNSKMWADITLSNRKNILSYLQKLIRRLILLEEELNSLEADNPKYWRHWFDQARVARDKIWRKKK